MEKHIVDIVKELKEEIRLADQRTKQLVSSEDLNAHASATTGVHGVGTSAVESQAGAQSKVDAHASATTGVHGVGTSAVDSVAARDNAIEAHRASAVHSALQPPQVLQYATATYTGNGLEFGASWSNLISLNFTTRGRPIVILAQIGGVATYGYALSMYFALYIDNTLVSKTRELGTYLDGDYSTVNFLHYIWTSTDNATHTISLKFYREGGQINYSGSTTRLTVIEL